MCYLFLGIFCFTFVCCRLTKFTTDITIVTRISMTLVRQYIDDHYFVFLSLIEYTLFV